MKKKIMNTILFFDEKSLLGQMELFHVKQDYTTFSQFKKKEVSRLRYFSARNFRFLPRAFTFYKSQESNTTILLKVVGTNKKAWRTFLFTQTIA